MGMNVQGVNGMWVKRSGGGLVGRCKQPRSVNVQSVNGIGVKGKQPRG